MFVLEQTLFQIKVCDLFPLFILKAKLIAEKAKQRWAPLAFYPLNAGFTIGVLKVVHFDSRTIVIGNFRIPVPPSSFIQEVTQAIRKVYAFMFIL